MDRRRFLRVVGLAGVAASAGCLEISSDTEEPKSTTATTQDDTPTATPSPYADVPHADDYGTVVDLAEAGADTDGVRPVDDHLAAALGDDTLVYFPPGQYRLVGPVSLASFDHLGVVGEDATIVPADGDSGYLFVLGRPGEASGLRFEGLEFDVSAPDTGPRAIQARVEDDLLVRDLSVVGLQDTDQGLTRFDVTDEDGTALVENLRLTDGGHPETLSTGCLVGPSSTGTITFRNCRISGFPDNGLYASPAEGEVKVLGGRYENNGIASVRVSAPAMVRDIHVRCDEAPDNFTNMRGIRLRHGDGVTVENCTVEMLTVTSTDGGIVLSSKMGETEIRDTVVRSDVDGVAAIRAKNIDAADGSLHCRNVKISGEAAGAAAVEVVDRESCTLEGLCIEQSGEDRDGVYLLRAHETSISDTVIDVTGEPVVVEQSHDVVRDFTSDASASCPADRS